MALSKTLDELKSTEAVYNELALEMLGPVGAKLYAIDLLVLGAVQRSLHLLPAFLYCIETRNFFAAAPLLRMQLDNCVRVSAAWIVQYPHEFANQVMDGTHIRKLTDQAGHKLTDKHLVEVLSKDHPWIKPVYDKCSGFVHLSNSHIASAFTKEDDVGNSYNIHVGFGTVTLKDEEYIVAVEAFIGATEVLFTYMRSWIKTKANPDELRKIQSTS